VPDPPRREDRSAAKLARRDGLHYPRSKNSVPTSTVHKALRNRIYSGDFDFDGTRYVSRELWQEVQDRLSGRQSANRARSVTSSPSVT